MTPPRTRAAIARGTVLDRYIILDLVGSGGMGAVYAAYDAQLDRKVAIKVLHPHFAAEDGAASTGVEGRLLREAQAMARLSHPNVVAIHDVGTFEDQVFLAMEHVEGATLREWMATPRRWTEVLSLFQEAGRGLAAAHAAGLVHRDFKPENVLVTVDGHAKVSDFGVARAAIATAQPANGRSLRPASATPSPADDSMSAVSIPQAQPTGTGCLLGTVGYFPPEQGFGETVDARSDQFSFAVTLYAALYGCLPYPVGSADRYIEATLRGPRPAPSGVAPAWVSRAILRALAPEPEDRYASMEALLEALSPPVRRLPRRLAWSGAVLALLAAATFLVIRERRPATDCDALSRDLTGVWDTRIAADIESALTRPGAGGADRVPILLRTLNAYARDWSEMRVDNCRATRVARTQPPDVYALRSECLDQERSDLDALTGALRKADPEVTPKALELAYGLSSPAWCADVHQLRASPGLPPDPAKRAAVLGARDALADAREHYLRGHDPEARAAALHGLELARDSGDRGTQAQALLSLGRIEQTSGDLVSATETLRGAVQEALAAGDDTIVVKSATRLELLLGEKLYRPDEAELAHTVAVASIERMGGSELLSEDVDIHHAAALLGQGLPERAIVLEEALVRSFRPRDDARLEAALNNLGYSYHLAGRHQDAIPVLREARALHQTRYGSDDDVPLCNEGAAELGLGHLAEARADLESALTTFLSASPKGFWTTWALGYLARTATAQGDSRAALEYARRAVALVDAPSTPPRLLPVVAVGASDALLAAGDAETALALCGRALRAQERVGVVASDRVYEWDSLRCEGEALIALRRPAEAVPLLERSVTMTRRTYAEDLSRARADLERARAAAGADAPSRTEPRR